MKAEALEALAWVRVAAGLLAFLGPVSLSAEGPTSVTLRSNGTATFEVVFHRTSPAGAGIAIAGMLGAAIQGGVQVSQDNTLTEKLAPLITAPSCTEPVVAAMTETFLAQGWQVSTDEPIPDSQSVTVTVNECGFRRTDDTDTSLTSFVKLQLASGGLTPEAELSKEQIVINGRERYSHEVLSTQAGLAQAELDAVLGRAGKRAASKIIYKK